MCLITLRSAVSAPEARGSPRTAVCVTDTLLFVWFFSLPLSIRPCQSDINMRPSSSGAGYLVRAALRWFALIDLRCFQMLLCLWPGEDGSSNLWLPLGLQMMLGCWHVRRAELKKNEKKNPWEASGWSAVGKCKLTITKITTYAPT